MNQHTRSQQGSITLILVAVLAVLLVIGAGVFVWQRNKNDKQVNNSTPNSSHSSKDGQPGDEQKVVDAYKDWQTYRSDMYGLNFRYPAEWRVEEVEGTTEPASSSKPVTTRYAINLKLMEDTKYNGTASVEVLNQNIQQVAEWYEASLANPTETKKSTSQIEGKEAIQYASPSRTSSTVHLFSVGQKTYLISSINESLNQDSDKDYWQKFQQFLDSVQIIAP
jgi:hypothetical protein